MEGHRAAAAFCPTVDQGSDLCYHSDNARLSKAQDRQISCPKNIDDFLALYRHEDRSIQEFLDCLEDPKPSRNTASVSSEKCSDDSCVDQVVHETLPSISATKTAALSNVSRTSLDSLRADTRRAQNRKSQQRYRLKLKSSAQPYTPRPRNPKPKAQPTCPQHTPVTYSCQRLHRAMLTILGSRKEADSIFQQRTTGSSSTTGGTGDRHGGSA